MFEERIRAARRESRVQAALIVLALVALTALVGGALFGRLGVLFAAALGLGVAVLSPAVPTRWVVRASGARPLRRAEIPGLFEAVAELARRARLPRPPSLHLHPSPQQNAFAVGGPDEAAVVVSAGALRTLPPRELVAVLAHEVSHVRHRDVAVMRLATTLGHVTAALSRAGVLVTLLLLPVALLGGGSVPWSLLPVLWLAPVGANALRLALSRRRELDADLGAVELTGDAEALARALVRLERGQRSLLERLLGVRARSLPAWLRTHPTTAERVRRLQALRVTPAARLVASTTRLGRAL